MVQDLILNLQAFTSSLPEFVQWIGVMLAAAIPFVESYTGSVLGILVGVNPIVAVLAAVVGNMVSMLIVVASADKLRSRLAVRNGGGRSTEPSARTRKLRERFDRYGVAGVSLLGQTILPSQITSAAMVSFGASRNAVMLWQTVSIILWGVAFGVLATVGINLLG